MAHCEQCLSGDLAVLFGHDCPHDVRKAKHGTYGIYVASGTPTGNGNGGSGNGRGGYHEPRATDKQIAFAISLGLPEHIARHMTKAAASEHIARLLEENAMLAHGDSRAQGGAGTPKPANPASEKQIAFIRNLLADRPGAFGGDVDSLSKNDASALIKQLLATPKTATPKPDDKSDTAPCVVSPVANATGAGHGASVDEGFYVGPGDVIYKVQRAVHGSGNLYAKILNSVTGEFEYQSGLIRDVARMLRDGTAERLTLEKAKS